MGAFFTFIAWEIINVALEYTAVAWVKLPRFFAAVVAVNLLTHPLFVYLLPHVGRETGTLLTCEFVIFAVEAAVLVAIYGLRHWRCMTLASLAMNSFSFGVGVLLSIG